ncbi:uncharacterized protein PHACADRAFT_251276 [Phanerochaete carnosa HHB-10118-sp]|uniref:Uncharacterized protein n=1 Tax=Phanerochaete carnosa (strain HHB-10118-sp) TaxID=650164 RepID=K5V4M8_PHACS|nr:uncharacterized protein PHACADRAFT_251276 [Phanerochaete carnosa HHB-10118-sp]EKM57581.1 hypothetical protein PHACADRAFT_251276 [Phanerochaete carnosa HHB-10118-sp]
MLVSSMLAFALSFSYRESMSFCTASARTRAMRAVILVSQSYVSGHVSVETKTAHRSEFALQDLHLCGTGR